MQPFWGFVIVAALVAGVYFYERTQLQPDQISFHVEPIAGLEPQIDAAYTAALDRFETLGGTSYTQPIDILIGQNTDYLSDRLFENRTPFITGLEARNEITAMCLSLIHI